MRSPSLNYRSLLILYGTSALVLLPFGAGYAYVCLHGWDKRTAFLVFVILGAIVALACWEWLEPGLLAGQPSEVATPRFYGLPMPMAAAGLFVISAGPLPTSPPDGITSACPSTYIEILVLDEQPNLSGSAVVFRA